MGLCQNCKNVINSGTQMPMKSFLDEICDNCGNRY